MSYLEFLRQKAEFTIDASYASQAQGSKSNEDVQMLGSLFGEEFTTTERGDGVSVFHLASQGQEQIEKFFSFGSVRKDAVQKVRKEPIADLNMANIPAKYRDEISVKTLPNGTEVLTFAYTNYKKLRPEMQQRIAVFNEVAAEKGYTFIISDGFRSIEESNRARAKKGNMVAPGGQSPHNFGAAFDCAVYKKGGERLSTAEMKVFTREVQRRSKNITWGGDFKSKSFETWHFELSDWKNYKT